MICFMLRHVCCDFFWKITMVILRWFGMMDGVLGVLMRFLESSCHCDCDNFMPVSIVFHCF